MSASIKPDLLLTLFAGLMLAAAAAMLRRRRPTAQPPAPVTGTGLVLRTGPRDDRAISGPGSGALVALPDSPAPVTLPALASFSWPQLCSSAAARQGLKIVAAATGVGLLTGFFGVGGGFVIVPALVLALGFKMPAAVGTSLLVIAINSAAALAARLGSHVHFDWPLLVAFTLTALAGTLAGNRIASRADPARLTASFTVLLVAVAVYSLGRSLPGLADHGPPGRSHAGR